MISIEFVPLEDRPFLTFDVDLTLTGEGGVNESSPARRSADVTSEAERRPALLASRTSPPAASASLDETDLILAAASSDLTDAVVRIRVKASEEQWRRVDTQAVRRHVEENGGRLVQIVPELERAARARVEGVDETLAPAAAVRLWSEAQELSDQQRDGVLGVLGRYLETAA